MPKNNGGGGTQDDGGLDRSDQRRPWPFRRYWGEYTVAILGALAAVMVAGITTAYQMLGAIAWWPVAATARHSTPTMVTSHRRVDVGSSDITRSQVSTSGFAPQQPIRTHCPGSHRRD